MLKKIGWYAYAALATILTLGVFPRFHLITVRKRTLGGVRAGNFGCIHVYVADGPTEPDGWPTYSHLVIQKMFSMTELDLNKIAYINRKPIVVSVESTGGKIVSIATLQARKLETFLTLKCRIYWKTGRMLGKIPPS